jgi:RimJ/RimL family protein N-acetyltransferase
MILNKYNIILEPLNFESLEKLRLWRNSASVSQFMEYRTEISVEQQQLWFANIDSKKEYYFIIKKDLNSIGMIHVNKINSELKSGEVGLFIGENKFQGTGIAFGASLNLLDFVFDELKLNEVFAKVNNANKNAILYNAFIGFTEEKPLNSDFKMWKLTHETYKKTKAKIENCIL